MNRILRLVSKRTSIPNTTVQSTRVISSYSKQSIICGQIRPILSIKHDISFAKRYKRTKKENTNNEDSDDEDIEVDDSSQLIKYKTSSLRMDSVLKHALSRSRNKIETAFYESRIRVNGEKVLKKSHTLEVGDEVDLIKGPSPHNPDFLLVSRIEILSANLDGDELLVKLRRFKTLLINNYSDKWKPSQ